MHLYFSLVDLIHILVENSFKGAGVKLLLPCFFGGLGFSSPWPLFACGNAFALLSPKTWGCIRKALPSWQFSFQFWGILPFWKITSKNKDFIFKLKLRLLPIWTKPKFRFLLFCLNSKYFKFQFAWLFEKMNSSLKFFFENEFWFCSNWEQSQF